MVYLMGSVPIQCFYAAALSGWYWDYPMWLFVPILGVLVVPLVLLVLKKPSAPRWNVVLLWGGAGLVLLRVLTGLLFADQARLTVLAVAIMVFVVSFAIIWAMVWTHYFRNSDRIASTFA